MPPPATMPPSAVFDEPRAVRACGHHLRAARGESARRAPRRSNVTPMSSNIATRWCTSDVLVVERGGSDAVVGHGNRGLYSADVESRRSTPNAPRRGPEPPDLSEKGGIKNGQPQRSDDRLFMQLLAFGGCRDTGRWPRRSAAGVSGVLYEDVNDPARGGAADVEPDPGVFVDRVRPLLNSGSRLPGYARSRSRPARSGDVPAAGDPARDRRSVAVARGVRREQSIAAQLLLFLVVYDATFLVAGIAAFPELAVE